MSASNPVISLVADVGGTNTRVGLAIDGVLDPSTIARHRNADYSGLDPILRHYMTTGDKGPCSAACIAMAGPVRDGVGIMTNLDWSMDEDTLRRATGASRAAVLNDLQAQGYALPHLHDDARRVVVSGSDTANAPLNEASDRQLVIGVGTGFNAAPVHRAGTGFLVAPSECGHANLPIRSEQELRLCRFVETAHGFPAIEDLLSGRGLERLFSFLTMENGAREDCGAAIIMERLGEGDQVAEATGRLFVKLLGTVVGNLALIHLPFGGIYLVGGVARAFAPYLDRFGFETAFLDKGRFAGFMQNFPITVVEDDYAALAGCLAYVMQDGAVGQTL